MNMKSTVGSFNSNYYLPSYIYVAKTLASSPVCHCLCDFLIDVFSTRGNCVSVMLYVNKF